MIAHETPYASPAHPPSPCAAERRQTPLQRSLTCLGLAGVGALAFLLAAPAARESYVSVALEVFRLGTLLWIAVSWGRGGWNAVGAMVHALTTKERSPEAFVAGLALFTAHGVLGVYCMLAVSTHVA